MLDRKNIKHRIQKEGLLYPKEKVLAGFSGGSDSAALCHILAELQEELGFSLELIYIQHGLRGQESVKEEEFVRQWASTYHLPLTVVAVDVLGLAGQKKLSVETAARQLRHEAFRKLAQEKGNAKIALAHHAKDQAETVLMHFLRGSGVPGLTGMKQKEGIYLRPLLNYAKKDILDYLIREQVPWCEDSSNAEQSYRRNRVRLELIPYLEEHFNPNLVKGLAEFAGQMQDLQNYLQPQIEAAFQQTVHRAAARSLPKAAASMQKRVMLHRDTLKAYPIYLQQMVIRWAMEEAKGSVVNLEKSHIKRAISLLEKETGKCEELIEGWQVRNHYDNLIFERKEGSSGKIQENKPQSENVFFVLGLDRIHRNRYIKVIKDFILLAVIDGKAEAEKKRNAWTQVFDLDRLPDCPVFRLPRAEDYIVINAAGNRKRLKDDLADRKVPREIRRQIPVMASADEIIWVPGQRIGYPYRITDQTKRFLKLTILGRTGKCRKLK